MKALRYFFSDLVSGLGHTFTDEPACDPRVTTALSDPLWFATLPRRLVRRRIRRRHPWIV